MATDQTMNTAPSNVRATSSVAYYRRKTASIADMMDNIKFECLDCALPLSLHFLCVHKHDGSESHELDNECFCGTPTIGMQIKAVME